VASRQIYILLMYFRSVEEHLKYSQCTSDAHCLHSACSEVSGSFWKDRCGCSEKLGR